MTKKIVDDNRRQRAREIWCDYDNDFAIWDIDDNAPIVEEDDPPHGSGPGYWVQASVLVWVEYGDEC